MEFEHSESIKTILPALIEVQTEMPQLSKDKDNPHAKSKYVTLDNILGTLLPLLNEREIFLTQLPVEENTESSQRIGVITTFLHKNGEYIKYPAVLYEFEKGGRMNLTQSVGSIISYARRYALTSILALSTSDDDDGVNSGSNNGYSNNNSNSQNKPPKKVSSAQVKTLNTVIGTIADLVGQSTSQATQVLLNAGGMPSRLEDIDENQFGKFLNYLNTQRNNYQAKVKENKPKDEDPSEQTSLMEGNTTKAQGSD